MPLPGSFSTDPRRVLILTRKLKSVVFGPAVPEDPVIPVIPSLLVEQVLNFITVSPSSAIFRHISLLDIDHGTLIPDYFNDSSLVHLAFSLFPQFGDEALKKIALNYMESDAEEESDMDLDNNTPVEKDDDAFAMKDKEDSDVDLEVLDEAPYIFRTPSKKKTIKYREQLDDSFLRSSRRLSGKAKGYKDAKSAKIAEGEAESSDVKKAKKPRKPKSINKKSKEPAYGEMEPIPLAMIAPSPIFVPAPHLPQEVLQGIGEGFLQI
jgi:hypothetical protein